MLDVLIKNGIVVDGTNRPRRVADVGIAQGVIVAVGTIHENARQIIDATGLLVTPGFVDIHTHYDGQVTWDPYLTPSGFHGATTVVMGNCGVGFAPCKLEDRDWLINVMEGVEDIPGAALHEGISWNWQTFPEYLDYLSARPLAIDVGTQVPHSAVRAWVMGRKSAENNEPCDKEIDAMRIVVSEALSSGALGFSTSRTPLHRTAEKVLVAGTFAPIKELMGMACAIKDVGHGVFEIAPDHTMVTSDIAWMKEIARCTNQNVVFNLSQTDQDPTIWREHLHRLDEAATEKIPLFAQCAGRAVGILMNWRLTAHPFARVPCVLELSTLPWSMQKERLKDPAFRARVLSEKPVKLNFFERFVTETFAKMFPMGAADYEPEPSSSVAALALLQGRTPKEVAYDLMMERDAEAMLYFPLYNYSDGNLDAVFELQKHPRTIMGLADGGAHCGAICDGGMPTFMLTHWTRDRTRGPKLALELVVHRQTQATANFYGLYDRGVIAPGYKADINIIDYDKLMLMPPRLVHDLPAQGRRLVQDAKGYRFTLVNGHVIAKDGQPLGVFPGKLIRGPQPLCTQPMVKHGDVRAIHDQLNSQAP